MIQDRRGGDVWYICCGTGGVTEGVIQNKDGAENWWGGRLRGEKLEAWWWMDRVALFIWEWEKNQGPEI